MIIKKKQAFSNLLLSILFKLFLCEEILCLTLLYELLSENISASLWRLVHTDTLDHLLECTGLEGCDCFLCHFLILLNYLISR